MKYQPKVAITLNKSISPILHRNTTGIKLNKIFKMKFKFYEVERSFKEYIRGPLVFLLRVK